MRGFTAGLAMLAFTVLLTNGLIWAEPCQKAEGQQPMMSMYPMMMRHMMSSGMMPDRMEKEGDPIKKELRSLGGPGRFVRHAEKLGLSEEQVENLKAIKSDHKKATIKKEAEVKIAHVELEELLDQEPVNFDRVKSKISQISEMETQMRLAHLTSIQKAHKVLTADQLEKTKTLKRGGCREAMSSEKLSSPTMQKMTREMMTN
jgi:Spy/CpxP family protein refolding chaperone